MSGGIKLAAYLVFAMLPVAISAQEFSYKWERVAMDPKYDGSKVYEVDNILSSHQEGMSQLMEILIYADEEIVTRRPESALSNLAADVLLYTAKDFIKNSYPVISITNFGGIRNNFPKGAVRVYDVYATFPFDNTLVVAQLKGKDIRRIMESFAARNKFEAIGGLRIEVEDGKIEECLIGGKELDDDSMYNVATIDFLLDGGDRMKIGENAVSVINTGIVVRDAVTAYLRKLSAEGAVLEDEKDGRIIIED